MEMEEEFNKIKQLIDQSQCQQARDDARILDQS